MLHLLFLIIIFRSLHVCYFNWKCICASRTQLSSSKVDKNHLAVPVRFLSSLYAMCCLVLLSLNFFANPKSIKNNLLQCRPIPIRKLSGLMSRWMKFLLCTYSTRPIIWSASMRTVFIVNLLEQKLKRSSRLGPRRSITSTL